MALILRIGLAFGISEKRGENGALFDKDHCWGAEAHCLQTEVTTLLTEAGIELEPAPVTRRDAGIGKVFGLVDEDLTLLEEFAGDAFDERTIGVALFAGKEPGPGVRAGVLEHPVPFHREIGLQALPGLMCRLGSGAHAALRDTDALAGEFHGGSPG